MSERLSVTNIGQFVDGEFTYNESIERKVVKRKPTSVRKRPRQRVVVNKDNVARTASKRAEALIRLSPRMEKLVSTIELVNTVYEQQDETSKMLDEESLVKIVALIGFAYSDSLVDSCTSLVEGLQEQNKSIRGLLLRVSNLITAIARKDLAT
jgi:hypothetical protein